MIAVKKPYNWVSAHRDVEFTFDYDHVYPLFQAVGSDGFATFIIFPDGISSLSVGEYLYCTAEPYVGYHKVSEILFDGYYKTETAFTTNNTTSGNITFIEDQRCDIYSGYQTGHPLSGYHFFHRIATFKPEPNANGQLVVNISGYINKLFDVINSNDTAAIGALSEVWYNLFTRVEMSFNLVGPSYRMNVLNSAITSLELNRDYVDTGRSINSGILGNHYLSCGESKLVQIQGDYVVTGRRYVDGNIIFVPADFTPGDFDGNDFDITPHG